MSPFLILLKIFIIYVEVFLRAVSHFGKGQQNDRWNDRLHIVYYEGSVKWKKNKSTLLWFFCNILEALLIRLWCKQWFSLGGLAILFGFQCCVGLCHTSAWISRRCTYVPSFLRLPPPHRAPRGLQSAPDCAPRVLQRALTGALPGHSHT